MRVKLAKMIGTTEITNCRLFRHDRAGYYNLALEFTERNGLLLTIGAEEGSIEIMSGRGSGALFTSEPGP